ncbi:MAG: hypothetical protein R2769_16265 [Saprospiraceae bacterium]
MEVPDLKQLWRYRKIQESITYTAEVITIKGTLEPNDEDPNRLMYKLKNAVLVKS